MNSAADFVDVDTKARTCAVHGEYQSRFIGKPKTGIWTGCQTCVTEFNTQQEEQQRVAEGRRRQQALEEKLNTAGVPRRFRDRSFDNFDVTSPKQQKALDEARAFVAEFAVHQARGTTAVFAGPPGTGKNHLAMAIALALLAESRTVMAVTVREAVMMLRASYSDKEQASEIEVLRRLAGVDLLILDEVGVQSGTDFEHDQVFTLIDMRYREAKPMLFLTNLTKPEFEKAIGTRAFDRLQEAWMWVTFGWESYRRRG